MLIVGLANPGKEYESTRHNVGGMVLDAFVKQSGMALQEESKLFAQIVKSGDQIVTIPTTFMNNSGQAVAAIAQYYKIDPHQIVIIHDDLDVPLGEIRIKQGGGTAGHNGVASVEHHLQSQDFWRIRIGIGPIDETLIKFRTADTSGFVLSRFDASELPVVQAMVDMVCSQLTNWLTDPRELVLTTDSVKGTDA